MLIRVSLSLSIFYFAFGCFWGKPSEPLILIQISIAAAGGIFLLAGLWTPAMGVLVALNEVSIVLFFSSAQREEKWIHVFIAIIAASVAMTGPGAWSIDARLFGRKRFDIGRTSGKRRPPNGV